MNWFKKIQSQIEEVSPAFAGQNCFIGAIRKSDAQVVEKIHNTFYTEVDRLLAQAMNSHSLETEHKVLLEKSSRLERLGFIRTAETKEAKIERDRIHALSKENRERAALCKAINYFSQKYPIYKFITEDSVAKICEKYGLIYGEVKHYIGTVPDKNLKQIENFKVAEEDLCYQEWRKWDWGELDVRLCDFKKYQQYREYQKKKNDPNMPAIYDHVNYSTSNGMAKCPLEICAPATDFDMTNMELKGKKLTMKAKPPLDPVVLEPVYFNSTKYYLIVTAWGPEASDPDVVNERMN